VPGADITVGSGVSGRNFNYSAFKLEKELGFSPEWTIEAGIKETIRKLREKAGLSAIC
jgi:nucleoside-diphosphate-sugar epimerase